MAGIHTHIIHSYTGIHTCRQEYIHTYISAYMPTYTHTYHHACIHTYMQTYIHAHTYTHTHIHTHREADTHSYIHAYNHTGRHTYKQAYAQREIASSKLASQPTGHSAMHTHITQYRHILPTKLTHTHTDQSAVTPPSRRITSSEPCVARMTTLRVAVSHLASPAPTLCLHCAMLF